MKKITFIFICLILLFIAFPLNSKAIEGFKFTSPTAGTTYNAGDPVTIRWTQGVDSSDISVQWLDYSVACGSSTCYKKISYDLKSTDTSYTWQIPPFYVSGDTGFKLFVSYLTDNNVGGGVIESEKIHINTVGNIEVTSPKQGGVYETDDTVEVLFDISAGIDTGATKYDLYRGSSLIEESIYISGTKKWWVKNNYQESNDYRIKVTVGTLEAYSDYFTIKPKESSVINIFSPLKGQVLKIGGTYNINWNVGESYRRVQIWLDVGEGEDGFRRILPITPFAFDTFNFNSIFTSNNGSFSWKIPSAVDVSSVNFNSKSYSYVIQLNSDNGSYQTTVVEASTVIEGNQSTVLLEPPYQITPGQYRIYVDLTNTGSVLNASAFSDFFTISDSSSTPTPAPTPTPISSPVYSFSDIKPGWLVKNNQFAEVFYVNADMELRWITNEQSAAKHFGSTWSQLIKGFDDLSSAGLVFSTELKESDSLSSSQSTTYSIDNIQSGWLVKNNKFAEVFYVDSDMKLRWIINEAAAVKHFGSTWSQMIKEFDDLSSAGLGFGDQMD